MAKVQFRKLADKMDREKRRLSERGASLLAGLFYLMVRDAEALALARHVAFDTDN